MYYKMIFFDVLFLGNFGYQKIMDYEKKGMRYKYILKLFFEIRGWGFIIFDYDSIYKILFEF